MGYRIVVFGTPSLAPKLNFLTLSTIWATNSGAFILLESTAQAETAPLGSMVIRSTILPRKGRILAQFGIVDPVERRLVIIEQNLDLFVGSGRASSGTKRLRLFRQPAPPYFRLCYPYKAQTIASGRCHCHCPCLPRVRYCG